MKERPRERAGDCDAARLKLDRAKQPIMDIALIYNIRRMLWQDWDPIGVNTTPAAADEYDSYASGIATLVHRDATKQEFFDHLWTLERMYMGLDGNRIKTDRFATALREFTSQYHAQQ